MRYLLTDGVRDAAQVAPEREAVRCNGQSLSYGELWQRALALAWTLRDQGVARGDRVGIYFNKSLESAVALYGIMLAGAAYVPLDPFAPLERLRYVIQDCGIQVLVTGEGKRPDLARLAAALPELHCCVGVAPGDDLPTAAIPWDQVVGGPERGLPVPNLVEQDLAYILYTSGSTGNPKGIMHTHRSGLSFAEWAAHTYELRAEDRVSNHAPLHFDLSTFDFFATAIAGGTVVIIPEVVTKFPASLAKLMEQERLSVWYSVPFALIQLLLRGGLAARDLSSLRWVLFAGEPFPTKHLRDLMAQLPGARFSNLYGPTETNVCTYYHVPPLPADSDEPIPIGRPCANVEDLVLDGDDRPVAPGEVGELLIRSPLVMQGYWGRPDLTARGFYHRTIAGQMEAIYYRTGDLVMLQPDGNYKYLGRKDRQIKTRGYRVELDEIEVALLAHPAVHEAAVYPVPDGQGSNLIKAAVVPTPGESLTVSMLMEHLSSRLPAYAVPAAIDILEEFPRTSTGKINRRELQALAATAQA
ncbi:amino acid adenylation domain-containing protein [Litorilinea aerophila]|uniref:Amino acid adenylation domain-containing protein n=1 Tax=Litorilinea aerophila TaxID=1204385 RepID=A0A540VFF0_9CHLR|nr:amino acid adenylation domain-containing protein [Litorilinea aerophila]MCC9076777.1 amino acid adenylation domain-containing protein [Litorilinea aerophila]